MVGMSDEKRRCKYVIYFFFNDTATTEIYTLSLHDALPISLDVSRSPNPRLPLHSPCALLGLQEFTSLFLSRPLSPRRMERSEEHTSELQSRQYLVCRLLLEKKKKFLSFSFVSAISAPFA